MNKDRHHYIHASLGDGRLVQKIARGSRAQIQPDVFVLAGPSSTLFTVRVQYIWIAYTILLNTYRVNNTRKEAHEAYAVLQQLPTTSSSNPRWRWFVRIREYHVTWGTPSIGLSLYVRCSPRSHSLCLSRQSRKPCQKIFSFCHLGLGRFLRTDNLLFRWRWNLTRRFAVFDWEDTTRGRLLFIVET